MIRNDHRAAIYDNPSIDAVIDFKWNAAKQYFLRNIFVYFIFALTYALIIDSIRGVDLNVSEYILYFLPLVLR